MELYFFNYRAGDQGVGNSMVDCPETSCIQEVDRLNTLYTSSACSLSNNSLYASRSSGRSTASPVAPL